VKASLAPGLSFERRLVVDEARCIGFMGSENRVYATPQMVNDVEHACRDFLLAHLDAGEDSVGAQVSIDHLGPTPPDFEIQIRLKIARIEGRRVAFEFTVRDAAEEVGRGTHVRFVVDTAKTRERIAAKRAKLAGGRG
jgi:fluoroacetyl-CoA thioesterase